ncbi:MAG: hypothetical protein Q9163_003213 [Psora crenata]
MHDVHARPGTPHGRSRAIYGQSPSSIQSMLKNATETGDVGQLFINPGRKPQPAFRGRLAGPVRGSSRSGRHQGTDGHFDIHGDRQPSPRLLRHDGVAYSAVSSQPSHNSRAYRDPSAIPSMEEYRSYSMTQSSYISHNSTNRYLYLDKGHGGGVSPGGRPRSPFAYPTRLKRPGYRPSSPGLSEINRFAHYSRPNSRPVSPASIYSMNAVAASRQQNSNQSDPSVRYFPPAHVKAQQQFQNRSPPSSQPSSPRPAPGLRNVASSSRLPRVQLPMQEMWTHPESPPPSANFYDYTEAFEELHHSQRVSMSTMNLNELTVSKSGRSTQLEPEAGAPELESLGRVSTEEFVAESARTMPNPSTTPSLRVSLDQRDAIIPAELEAAHTSIGLKDSEVTIPGSRVSGENAIATVGDGDARTAAPFARTTTPLTDGTLPARIRSHGRRTAGDKSVSVQNAIRGSGGHERSLSSSTDSMRTAESNSYLEQEGFRKPMPMSPGPAVATWGRTESKQATHSANIQHQEAPRSLIFEDHSLSEHSGIVSPTPERSVTSPISRDRFSKILCLDESLSDSEDVVKRSQQREVPTDKDGYRSPLQARDSNINNTTINTSILEDPGSENEQELSAGLLKTFGRRLDRSALSVPASALTAPMSRRSNASSPLPTKMQKDVSTRQQNISQSKFPAASVDPELSKPPRHSAAAIQHRHAQVIPSNSKPILRTDKELPPVPKKQRSFVAIMPATESGGADHSHDSIPVSDRISEDLPTTELKTAAPTLGKNSYVEECLKPPPVLNPNSPGDRDSVASSHGSRPWNNDSSYTWDDQPPDLEVTVPQPADEVPPATERGFPRFKLRIQRASTSSGGTTRLTKPRPSCDETLSGKRNSGHEIIKTATFTRKAKPRVSVYPGHNNSSHDIGNESLRTRFVESFDPPPQITTVISSPTITLLPPSPGHEVRSFFSDDSSQARTKGSIRKRFSDFKARHSQTNSTDEVRGVDRGLLSSALGRSRASGRSSRQSQNTAGGISNISHAKRVRSRVVNKVRFWWHRSEDRIRGWGWRMRSGQDKRPALHTNLHPAA